MVGARAGGGGRRIGAGESALVLGLALESGLGSEPGLALVGAELTS